MKKLIYLISVAVAFAGFSAQAVTLHEWTFDTDPSGRTLANATNTVSTNRFSAGGAGFLETDGLGTLLCTFNDSGTSGLWTNGALLSTGVGNLTNGTYFIRYDLEYDINDTSNDSGTLAGLAFTDATGTKVAGMALQYDVGAVTAPTNLTVTDFTNLTNLVGKVSFVARVDMTTKKMDVWYDLAGMGSFSAETSPQATNIAVNMTSINNLRLQMTGDFTNSVKVSQIQMSDSFASAIAAPPELLISVSNSLSGLMDVGNTNIVSVIIRNNGGRPATGATSILTNNITSSAFTISSNNAAQTLAGGLSITNTYTLTANTNGIYHFTIRATSAETNSAQTNLTIVAGAQISYLTNSIADGAGGKVAGQYESGETISITIISTNNGARTVTNIINTLSANPAYFTITPASNTYPSMAVGRAQPSTYTVVISNTTPAGNHTFSVTNRAGDLVWTDSFTLKVSAEANPTVTNSLIINVAPGETTNKTLLLSNFGTSSNPGNASVTFMVSDDGTRPIGGYIVTTQQAIRANFYQAQFEPETVYTNWSTTTPIGFDMPVQGTKYSDFSVSKFGNVTLSTTNGQMIQLSPFTTGTGVNTNSVRFRKNPTQLVIAWGNATGLEFQAWLNSNGTIQYLYQYGTWGAGNISLGSDPLTQTITHTPGLTDRDSLLLTPRNWIAYTPTNGNLAGQSSTNLTFTVDATSQTTGTHSFNASIRWGNGTSNVVAVTVIVGTANPQLQVPSPFTFWGSAGLITRTNMVVTNSGNVALSYTLTDSGLQGASYNWTNTTYGWRHIPAVVNYTLSAAQLGTQALNLGFPFVYFGNIYTALVVNANGTLTLGSAQTISPFGSSITMDDNASVRVLGDQGSSQFTVTWENMAQSGGGSNQTFQAVLNRDGSIRFNYNQLGSGWPNGAIHLADASGTVSGTLSNSSTAVTSTNYTYVTNYITKTIGNVTMTTDVIVATTGTNVVTTYTSTANYQSLDFTPGKLRIISASPVTGTIPAGGTTNILITGDARSLTPGAPANSVTNSTTLTFSYAGISTNALVTFIATNSSTAPYASDKAKADMWGADPVFTSQQNADGSYTLSWLPADDGISRAYRVWYTTSLSSDWIKMEPLIVNGTSYVVDINDIPAESAIFYKVTVE